MEKRENIKRSEKLAFEVWAQRMCALVVALTSLLAMACGSKDSLSTSKVRAAAGDDLKSLTVSKFNTSNFIDAINGISDLAHPPVHIPRSHDLIVNGWAVDSSAKQPASRVYIDVDGELYAGQYGIARPDVAAVLREPNYTHSGFTATLPAAFGDGEHRLTVDIVNYEGSAYYIGTSVSFVLQSSALP